MKALVVYDSVHGNTEKVAQAIGAAIPGTVLVSRVGLVSARDLDALDLLVIGSPTVGGRPTASIQAFVNGLPESTASRVRLAAFDTRITLKFARVFGYAAPRVAEALARKCSGGPVPAEGFIVRGRSGPLADGELERAAEWGRKASR